MSTGNLLRRYETSPVLIFDGALVNLFHFVHGHNFGVLIELKLVSSLIPLLITGPMRALVSAPGPTRPRGAR